jgi:hypothetical protein
LDFFDASGSRYSSSFFRAVNNPARRKIEWIKHQPYGYRATIYDYYLTSGKNWAKAFYCFLR